MRLTIFAATGDIGQRVLERAIDTGHDLPRGFRRADADQFMLRVIDQPETIGQAIAVAY